ncbi:hypothetical protein ACDX66_17465 [Peribacillus frigoritolerans]
MPAVPLVGLIHYKSNSHLKSFDETVFILAIRQRNKFVETSHPSVLLVSLHMHHSASLTGSACLADGVFWEILRLIMKNEKSTKLWEL